jgi:hypothetical protein
MSLLGCNSKLLWHEIYQQIIDIISTKTEKSGIIVCKYFHDIHSELLENFYSYIQQNTLMIDLKFIIITEELSFIPDCILNCCEIINITRPSKMAYRNCYIKNKFISKLKLENVTNIKNLHICNEEIMLQHKIICNKIINSLINIHELQFLKFRDFLYDIFIYNLNINECVWYILSSLINQKIIKKEHITKILVKTYRFFQYYNNNYRPIYHVENYFLSLSLIIHEFDTKV